MEKQPLQKSKKKNPLTAYISGYTPNLVTEQELEKVLMDRFPGINSLNFSKNSHYWNGSGYLDFLNEKDFKAFLSLSRVRLEQFSMNLVLKKIKTGKLLKKTLKDLKKRTLIVNNIPRSWDDSQLESCFQQFGKIENCYVLKGQPHIGQAGQLQGVAIYTKRTAALKCFLQKKIPLDNGEDQFLWVKYKDEEFNRIQIGKFQGKIGQSFGDFEFAEKMIYPLGIRNPRNLVTKRKCEFRRGRGLINNQVYEEHIEFHQTKPTSKKYFQSRVYLLVRANMEFWGLR